MSRQTAKTAIEPEATLLGDFVNTYDPGVSDVRCQSVPCTVAEIECAAQRAGHIACPALVETANGSGQVVYHLGWDRSLGELVVESIKLTPASAELIRRQF